MQSTSQQLVELWLRTRLLLCLNVACEDGYNVLLQLPTCVDTFRCTGTVTNSQHLHELLVMQEQS